MKFFDKFSDFWKSHTIGAVEYTFSKTKFRKVEIINCQISHHQMSTRTDKGVLRWIPFFMSYQGRI